MTGQTELLPCPFCGEPGSLNEGKQGWVVICSSEWDCIASPIYDEPKDAIQFWNKRASPNGGRVSREQRNDLGKFLARRSTLICNWSDQNVEGKASLITEANEIIAFLGLEIEE